MLGRTPFAQSVPQAKQPVVLPPPVYTKTAAPLTLRDDVGKDVRGFLDVNETSKLTNLNRWHRDNYDCRHTCPDGKVCLPPGDGLRCPIGTETGTGLGRCCQVADDAEFLRTIYEMSYWYGRLYRYSRGGYYGEAVKHKLAKQFEPTAHRASLLRFIKELKSKTGDIKFRHFSYKPYFDMVYMNLDIATGLRHNQNRIMPFGMMVDLVKIGAVLLSNMLTVSLTLHQMYQMPPSLLQDPRLFFEIVDYATSGRHDVWNSAANLIVRYRSDFIAEAADISNMLATVITNQPQIPADPLHYETTALRKRILANRVSGTADFAAIDVLLHQFPIHGEIEILCRDDFWINKSHGPYATGNVVSSDGTGHVRMTGPTTRTVWFDGRDPSSLPAGVTRTERKL